MVSTDYQQLLSFLKPRQTSHKLARWQAYIREFHLVIEHVAGRENLLPITISMKHNYSLDLTEQ